MYLHSLRNRLEKLTNGYFIYLKLIQIIWIFSDNLHLLQRIFHEIIEFSKELTLSHRFVLFRTVTLVFIINISVWKIFGSRCKYWIKQLYEILFYSQIKVWKTKNITFPKHKSSKIQPKIVERGKFDTHSIHVHDRSLSWLGTGT
jgi:hypothetical protein